MIARHAKEGLATINKIVTVPDSFTNMAPQFTVVHVQGVAVTIPADANDSVRIGAMQAKQRYDRQYSVNPSQALTANPLSASSSAEQALFPCFSTAPVPALFDDFHIVPNQRFIQLVIP